MKLLDLIEKDIQWIEVFYEEFYKYKEHDLETFTEFLKEVFKQNVNNEYHIFSTTVLERWEATNYIFIFGRFDNEKQKYVLPIYECSCGWDYCGETNWYQAKKYLEEELKEVEIKLC